MTFLVQIWPNFDLNWTIFDKNWSLFDINGRIQIEIIATIDRTAEIGLKKSIKSWFEYDLDQILAGGRSNCISLASTEG